MTIQLLTSLALLKVIRRDLLIIKQEDIFRTFKWYFLISMISGLLCFSFAIRYIGSKSMLIDYWGLLPLYLSISIFYFVHTLFLKANKKHNYQRVTTILIISFAFFAILSISMKSIQIFHLANTGLYLVMTIILFINTEYYDTFSIK